MKKTLLIAALAGLLMASCKKDYVCECVYSGSVSGTVSESLTKMKKKDAQEKCDSYDVNEPTYKAECSIK